MACIQYKEQTFRSNSRWIIDESNVILAHYADLGFVMTLRQLYYQLVKSNKIPNNKRSYNNLGNIIGDARLAGLIDWDYLEDRARTLRGIRHYGSPQQVLSEGIERYRIDMWENQTVRPEIWIEKDALSGVFEGICGELDVDLLACKGYLSLSEAHVAAMRFERIAAEGQQPIVFHFGDHDSSGIDMTRDILEKFHLFIGGAEVDRRALTMDQIKLYDLPPQPSKSSDPRAEGYRLLHGNHSWELDSLDPQQLTELVRQAVEGVRDEDAWNEALQRETEERDGLRIVNKHWKKVVLHAAKLDKPKPPRKPRKKSTKKKKAAKRPAKKRASKK